MRVLKPLTRRISAISMNSGTQVSTKLFMLPQLTSPRLLRLRRAPPPTRRKNHGTDREEGTTRQQDKKNREGDDDLKLRAHGRAPSSGQPLAMQRHRPQGTASWKSTKPR